MWFPRSLTMSQRRKLTSALFYTTAASAVITVALPSVIPCPAYRDGRAASYAHGWADPEAKKRTARAAEEQRPARVVVIQPEETDGA